MLSCFENFDMLCCEIIDIITVQCYDSMLILMRTKGHRFFVNFYHVYGTTIAQWTLM